MSYKEKLIELSNKLDELSDKLIGGYTPEEDRIDKQQGYNNYVLSSVFPNEYIKDKAFEALEECQRKM